MIELFMWAKMFDKIQDTRYKSFISDKKNITLNYNCKAKYILHNI